MGQPGCNDSSPSSGSYNVSPPSYLLCTECPFPRYDNNKRNPLKDCVNRGTTGCGELFATFNPICCRNYKPRK